jgi:hypothetical protein
MRVPVRFWSALRRDEGRFVETRGRGNDVSAPADGNETSLRAQQREKDAS